MLSLLPVVRSRSQAAPRVPGIIIGPLAKRHYVDHTQYDTLSILKTIEERFGLKPLRELDAQPTPLTNSLR